jgi:hypothetical protein
MMGLIFIVTITVLYGELNRPLRGTVRDDGGGSFRNRPRRLCHKGRSRAR